MQAILYASAIMTAVCLALMAATISLSAQTWCVIIILVAIGAITGAFTWTLCGRKDEDHIHATMSVCRMFFGIFVGTVVSALAISALYVYAVCSKHMSPAYWGNHSLIEVIDHAQTVPTSADSIEQGDLVVFYKFGCPDCDAVYDDANALAAESGVTLKWVSTDTDLGREFAETHGIDWTPTGVYVLNSKIGDTEIVQMHIDKTEDDQTILDADALTNLIEYQQKGK